MTFKKPHFKFDTRALKQKSRIIIDWRIAKVPMITSCFIPDIQEMTNLSLKIKLKASINDFGLTVNFTDQMDPETLFLPQSSSYHSHEVVGGIVNDDVDLRPSRPVNLNAFTSKIVNKEDDLHRKYLENPLLYEYKGPCNLQADHPLLNAPLLDNTPKNVHKNGKKLDNELKSKHMSDPLPDNKQKNATLGLSPEYQENQPSYIDINQRYNPRCFVCSVIWILIIVIILIWILIEKLNR